jgi:hypothetical protein
MTVIIQEVNVLDLIRALEGSVDCVTNWEAGGFSEMVEGKLESVWRYGQANYGDLMDNFSTAQAYPIVVCVNGSSEYLPDSKWVMGNGNHRLSIAIATCAETVLVAFNDDPDDYMCGDFSSASGY